ncbi:hypothetical protein FRB90_005986 [Tulasnella sp. 427]|nr:hypothetical protein FRB90_005986 [Tulasnella sp. 427]
MSLPSSADQILGGVVEALRHARTVEQKHTVVQRFIDATKASTAGDALKEHQAWMKVSTSGFLNVALEILSEPLNMNTSKMILVKREEAALRANLLSTIAKILGHAEQEADKCANLIATHLGVILESQVDIIYKGDLPENIIQSLKLLTVKLFALLHRYYRENWQFTPGLNGTASLLLVYSIILDSQTYTEDYEYSALCDSADLMLSMGFDNKHSDVAATEAITKYGLNQVQVSLKRFFAAALDRHAVHFRVQLMAVAHLLACSRIQMPLLTVNKVHIHAVNIHWKLLQKEASFFDLAKNQGWFVLQFIEA